MNKVEGVKYTHFRLQGLPNLNRINIEPRGGATVAYVERDGVMYAAAAYCNPHKDNFCYAYGRRTATARLAALLQHPELADANKWFVSKGASRDTFIAGIRDFMVDGLGYIHRGKKKQAKE